MIVKYKACRKIPLFTDVQMKLISLLTTTFVIVVSLNTCKENSTIVKFKGGSISQSDIDEEVGAKMNELKKAMYDAQVQAAQNAAMQKVIEIETRSKGKTLEVLQSEYMQRVFKPVSAANAEAEYNQRKGQPPYSKMSLPEFMAFMNNQRKNQLRRGFYQGLMRSYNIEVVLPEPELQRVDIDIKDEPAMGDGRLVIVEFSDYECSFCKRMQPVIRQLQSEYQGRIKWVFKDFPLSFHRNAMQAHISANCAGKQGKYFQYQSLLWNKAPDLKPKTLMAHAKEVGLDMKAFNSCAADQGGTLKSEINADIEYGSSVGVNGTPALYINGRKVGGLRPYSDVKSIVESELNTLEKNKKES